MQNMYKTVCSQYQNMMDELAQNLNLSHEEVKALQTELASVQSKSPTNSPSSSSVNESEAHGKRICAFCVVAKDPKPVSDGAHDDVGASASAKLAHVQSRNDELESMLRELQATNSILRHAAAAAKPTSTLGGEDQSLCEFLHKQVLSLSYKASHSQVDATFHHCSPKSQLPCVEPETHLVHCGLCAIGSLWTRQKPARNFAGGYHMLGPNFCMPRPLLHQQIRFVRALLAFFLKLLQATTN